ASLRPAGPGPSLRRRARHRSPRGDPDEGATRGGRRGARRVARAVRRPPLAARRLARRAPRRWLLLRALHPGERLDARDAAARRRVARAARRADAAHAPRRGRAVRPRHRHARRLDQRRLRDARRARLRLAARRRRPMDRRAARPAAGGLPHGARGRTRAGRRPRRRAPRGARLRGGVLRGRHGQAAAQRLAPGAQVRLRRGPGRLRGGGDGLPRRLRRLRERGAHRAVQDAAQRAEGRDRLRRAGPDREREARRVVGERLPAARQGERALDDHARALAEPPACGAPRRRGGRGAAV
ncbi:MAG: hypothetical protein AVDCRST_MAG11-410, partial [uncultured Gemmatimonadaceae bacterium]